ncbi:ArsR/SmtB family transcription factor [Streptomyces sp. NPDC051041]|uniref:ArsR/SmtB family transcription factor n=1 Tax=Streptomyces sp. NPDC051041 TaxID=3365640 RepID=UPI00379C1596
MARVVVADQPDPMWETLLSLHLLHSHDGPLFFDHWRQRIGKAATGVWGGLRLLAPPRGYSPDFLTPLTAEGTVDEGLRTLLRTPRRQLRKDMTELFGSRRPATWARALADGEPRALTTVAKALRHHHDIAVAPFWDQIRAQCEASRMSIGRILLHGGFARLTSVLHETLRWDSPVLHVSGSHLDGELRLDGRGLRLIPSFFCWPGPTLLKDPDLPPVLIHPVDHDLRWLTRPSADADPHRALAGLLGQTRAAILRAAADGCSTTDLAHRCRVSPATASHHAGVLREGRLITTRRTGGSVVHALTHLGAALLKQDVQEGEPA